MIALRIPELFALADEIEAYINEVAGELPYVDWDNLNEKATQLRAFANVLSTSDQEWFIAGELEEAIEILKQTRSDVAMRAGEA